MNHVDTFTGIGGFALAASRVWGDQYNPLHFVEIDPVCQKVLSRHWPSVPITSDINEFDGAIYERATNILTAGFPCQDISKAKNRDIEGIEGARSGLWKPLWRIIGKIRPDFAVLENSANILNRGIDVVLRDLAEIGYDAEWHCIPAGAIGAPHRRDRCWIVAYPHSLRWKAGQFQIGKSYQTWRKTHMGEFNGVSRSTSWIEALSQYEPADDGISGRVDMLRGYGNAIVPDVAQIIFTAIKEVMEL